jgi:hypothetical protein
MTTHMSKINSEHVNKPGKTILVKLVSNMTDQHKTFNKLDGLVSCAETKTYNSYFLTFDTIENATKAYATLSEDSKKYNIKFSYYRVFFTLNGLKDTTDYNTVKQELINFINDKTGASVLYCKLYKKDNKYIGCGDCTIDTMEGMNMLLNKDTNLKDFTVGSYSGTFFRYNNKKHKPNNKSELAK